MSRSHKTGSPLQRWLVLSEYLWLAEQVTGIQAPVLAKVANVKPKGDHCEGAKEDHLEEKEKSAVVGRGKGFGA